ncbi:hypothetical protein SprV_0501945700 [Sparganum proliferum]
MRGGGGGLLSAHKSDLCALYQTTTSTTTSSLSLMNSVALSKPKLDDFRIVCSLTFYTLLSLSPPLSP